MPNRARMRIGVLGAVDEEVGAVIAHDQQGLEPVASLEHAVTGSLQHLSKHLANGRLILEDEHSTC